eukprot:5685373-Pyramimonas_sp.AAC.1
MFSRKKKQASSELSTEGPPLSSHAVKILRLRKSQKIIPLIQAFVQAQVLNFTHRDDRYAFPLA